MTGMLPDRHEKDTMMGLDPDEAVPALAAHPYAAEMAAERQGWYRIEHLIRSLTPTECMVPGYFTDPDWAVRDLAAHLGTWLAEAGAQLERQQAGTYEGHDVDIEALNASFLAAMADQPWEVAWILATSGRSRMLTAWTGLTEPTDEAAWWIHKAGSEHYAEHLDRLEAWVAELISRR
jgi:hypothetical protein